MIQATEAKRLDEERDVYRLKLKPSILERMPAGAARFLRKALHAFAAICPWIRTFRPDWFWPSTIVVKKLKPDGYDPHFEREKRAYERLRPVWGTAVPIYYGEIVYDNSIAIVLSEVQGEPLSEQVITPWPDHDFNDLEEKLMKAFKILFDHGVVHGDWAWHNLIYVGERIVVVDFECAEFDEVKDWERSRNFREAQAMWNYLCDYRERKRLDSRPDLREKKLFEIDYTPWGVVSAVSAEGLPRQMMNPVVSYPFNPAAHYPPFMSQLEGASDLGPPETSVLPDGTRRGYP